MINKMMMTKMMMTKMMMMKMMIIIIVQVVVFQAGGRWDAELLCLPGAEVHAGGYKHKFIFVYFLLLVFLNLHFVFVYMQVETNIILDFCSLHFGIFAILMLTKITQSVNISWKGSEQHLHGEEPHCGPTNTQDAVTGVLTKTLSQKLFIANHFVKKCRFVKKCPA